MILFCSLKLISKTANYLFMFLLLVSCGNQSSMGIFETNLDIGKVGIAGSATYDTETDSYTISGSGENMWFNKDAFHYVWKKVSGDVSLSTRIAWNGKGINPIEKLA